MRTDMGVPLHQYYKNTLGKAVTKDNVIELCVLYASAPAIFQFSFIGDDRSRALITARDIGGMFCFAHGISWYSPYTRLVLAVLNKYPASMLADKIVLDAVFSTLLETKGKITNILIEAGLPDLDSM